MNEGCQSQEPSNKREWKRTDADKLTDVCLCPFRHITTFAATHVKNLARHGVSQTASEATITVRGSRLRHGQCRMSEPCDQDGFDPVVEVLEANDRRLETLHYTHVWP